MPKNRTSDPWITNPMLPRNHRFNRVHLVVMTNHHTKLEDPWAMSSLVIDWTRFVYGPTDGPTDGWLDRRHMQSNIPPLFRRGA